MMRMEVKLLSSSRLVCNSVDASKAVLPIRPMPIPCLRIRPHFHGFEVTSYSSVSSSRVVCELAKKFLKQKQNEESFKINKLNDLLTKFIINSVFLH